MEQLDTLGRLAMALAVGLLIGVERGWHRRELAEGGRVAGIRTFSLIGLLGGLWMVLGRDLGPLVMGFAVVTFGAFVAVSYVVGTRHANDISATTSVAALVAFALGALAANGKLELAAASAVVTTLVLGLKPVMHAWLERVSYDELMAALKLLVMSVVLLPVLPDHGYGPWQALNPFQIWWMVVLIAGTAFLGYVAARIFGPKRGIVVAGAFGGLTSSTAVSLSFARFAAGQPVRAGLFASGAITASAVMFPRLLVILAVVAPDFARGLALPLLCASLGGIAVVAVVLRRYHDTAPEHGDQALRVIANPFELGTALKFGVFLAAIMFAAHALNAWLGNSGVVLLGAVSGLADVDAVSLSLARMPADQLAPTIAMAGVLVAVLVNTLTKTAILITVGGRRMAAPALIGAAAMTAGGILGLAIAPLGLLFGTAP